MTEDDLRTGDDPMTGDDLMTGDDPRPGDERVSDHDAARPELTHLDESGHARMVEVGGKERTARRAVAEGRIAMSRGAFAAIRDGRAPKGDVLAVARIGGIMGGKRAGELIPLCHVLPEAALGVELTLDEHLPGVVARAEASITGRTGVEMEALTAVALALLTVHDMVKAIDPATEIGGIRLLKKEGGRSGRFERGDAQP
jgi:cyclic pyranopterin phosphate synthase